MTPVRRLVFRFFEGTTPEDKSERGKSERVKEEEDKSTVLEPAAAARRRFVPCFGLPAFLVAFFVPFVAFFFRLVEVDFLALLAFLVAFAFFLASFLFKTVVFGRRVAAAMVPLAPMNPRT